MFDLDGNLLEGIIPNKKRQLVVTWIGLHKEELEADWVLLQDGKQYFKIPPL
ncbi:MAG: DUF4160 domain-containing protein [Clostridiales bacterium]|nr:DUF4160 domain-containing protein [Clostridiales bacterium]